MEEKETTPSPEAMCAADRILMAIHGCWADSTFNLRKSELLAEYPEYKDDDTLQFFFEELEKAAKKYQSLPKMFSFAVKCEIGTYATTAWDKREILLYWDRKVGERNAELALSALTVWLSKEKAVFPLKPSESPTQNTKSVYRGNHPGADAALHTLINSIPYLQDKAQLERDCLSGLEFALRGDPTVPPPFHWFLPVRTEKAADLGETSNSHLGTNAVFTFGVIMI